MEMPAEKSALVLGATGLVGSHLVDILLEDPRFNKVKAFVRNPIGFEHPKLEEHIVDFDHPKKWKDRLHGDVLFSCMGTTLKQAGSKEAQYKVDFSYQHNAAEAAAKNGVSQYILVSSAGANSRAKNFYRKMKGELDESVVGLDFYQIIILRPSVLTGPRPEKRFMESLAIVLLKIFTLLLPPLRPYRPIAGAAVARVMVKAALETDEPRIEIITRKRLYQP